MTKETNAEVVANIKMQTNEKIPLTSCQNPLYVFVNKINQFLKG